MCPGICQKLGCSCRKRQLLQLTVCAQLRWELLTKKQLNFHHHTPISVADIPPVYSLSLSPWLSPLTFTTDSSHHTLLQPSHTHQLWGLEPYLMSVSHSHIYMYCLCCICSYILFYILLTFPNRAHATFLTVSDKQCPASWPQVQVVIKLSLKGRLSSRLVYISSSVPPSGANNGQSRGALLDFFLWGRRT